jgi:PKD repeat protein
MIKNVLAALSVLCLAAPGFSAEKKEEGKAPRLELRSSPRFGFSPINILFTAELKGGDDLEEYYCPEVEWDWDDGGKSVREGDCEPFQPGVTKIQRRFTEYHEYRRAGIYSVSVTLNRAGKRLKKTRVRVTVRAGAGDTTYDY